MSHIHPIKRKYWLISAALTAVYIVSAIILSVFFPFPQTGPGDFNQPALKNLDIPPKPDLMAPRDVVKMRCSSENHPARVIFPDEAANSSVYVIYCLNPSIPASGPEAISEVVLANAYTGEQILEGSLYRRLGVWKYYGLVKSRTDWIVGACALVSILLLGYVQLRNRAFQLSAGQEKMNGLDIAAVIAFALFSFVLPCVTVPMGLIIGKRYRTRAYTVLNIWLMVIGIFILLYAVIWSDFWALWATTLIMGAIGLAARFGTNEQPEYLMEAFSIKLAANSTTESMEAFQFPQPYPSTPPRETNEIAPPFTSITPEKLPNFNNVGGMDGLKREIRDTVGLMLAFRDEAEIYKISWNGFLLHGPPGVGKSFIAKAIAGEFGLNFIPIGPSELTSSYLGESARLITRVFEFAHEHIPCLLFFDEFDSLAEERDKGLDSERRLIVNQLLRSLEEIRDQRELIVFAATNDLGRLDPAIIRPGRFDYHLHIGYPDQEARRAILSSQLNEIPIDPNLDLDDIARRLDGSSAADIASIVRKASLDVFRKKIQDADDKTPLITQESLLSAILSRSGRDRPVVRRLSWDELILMDETKDELIEIQRMIENPELGHKLGVNPPSGILLHGPPGTGKTTIANVLAAESAASFYPISAAEILTKWFGESEQNIRKLFERARRNRPAIIFIDELDALAPRRTGFTGVQDSIVNQLLYEMDGMSSLPGVFVIGATNRPDSLDPALLRGGRLSRQIYIPLPDSKCRAKLFQLMTARMPLAQDANPLKYVDLTDGFSGADIEALCQQAAQEALNRIHGTSDIKEMAIEVVDFEKALAAYKQQRSARADMEEG